MKTKKRRSKCSAKKRILIVEDHPVTARGTADFIEQDMGLEVCGIVDTMDEALDLIAKVNPDLVLTDISLKGSPGGIQLTKKIRGMYPALPVIVFTIHDEYVYARHCFASGAKGYVMKQNTIEELGNAIITVLAGGTYVNEDVGLSLQIHTSKNWSATDTGIETLSATELDVLGARGRGTSRKQIAEALSCAPRTVDTFVHRIKTKLGLSTAAQVTDYARLKTLPLVDAGE